MWGVSVHGSLLLWWKGAGCLGLGEGCVIVADHAYGAQRFSNPFGWRWIGHAGSVSLGWWSYDMFTWRQRWEYYMVWWPGVDFGVKSAPMPMSVPPMYHLIQVPVWIPLACCAVGGAVVWWRQARRQRRGTCEVCGYDLAGLAPGAVCPECGGER